MKPASYSFYIEIPINYKKINTENQVSFKKIINLFMNNHNF